jgi:hypothetical protein
LFELNETTPLTKRTYGQYIHINRVLTTTVGHNSHGRSYLGDVCGSVVCGGRALGQLQLLQVDALYQLFPLFAPLSVESANLSTRRR